MCPYFKSVYWVTVLVKQFNTGGHYSAFRFSSCLYSEIHEQSELINKKSIGC